MDVFEETFTRARRRNRRVVKIDILIAVVCAHANHVALIGHDVDEFELPVEPADSRVGLAKLLARLDGKAEWRRVSELEADDGMRDPGRAPVIDREVDAGDLRDAHSARFPVRGVIGLGAVVTVANIVQGYFVALDLRPRELRDVELPIGFVARLEAKPPGKNRAEQNCEKRQLSCKRADQAKNRETYD